MVLANTRFNPTCTRLVVYGVLNLPGFDGLLGAGFLQQCTSYAISKQQDHKLLTFTLPWSQEVVTVKGVLLVAVESRWSLVDTAAMGATHQRDCLCTGVHSVHTGVLMAKCALWT